MKKSFLVIIIAISSSIFISSCNKNDCNCTAEELSKYTKGKVTFTDENGEIECEKTFISKKSFCKYMCEHNGKSPCAN